VARHSLKLQTLLHSGHCWLQTLTSVGISHTGLSCAAQLMLMLCPLCIIECSFCALQVSDVRNMINGALFEGHDGPQARKGGRA
jgi:hypothetical protein